MARMNEPLLDRRSLLGLLAGSALAACTKTVMTPIRTPAIFLAHGFPMLLDVFPEWAGELRAWAANLGRPKAILMISAHWEEMPIALGALRTVPLYYDFGGKKEEILRANFLRINKEVEAVVAAFRKPIPQVEVIPKGSMKAPGAKKH